MNSLINLMAIVGVRRTLIITNREYAESHFFDNTEDVAPFFLDDNMLHRYDELEMKRLQASIERSGCVQVVFLGILDDDMRKLLLHHTSLYAVRAGLNFKTPLLPNRNTIVEQHLYIHALLEQHVMTQCNHLMELHYIREKIRKGHLVVKGIAGSPNGEDFKTVFTNGVRFNDLVSSN